METIVRQLFRGNAQAVDDICIKETKASDILGRIEEMENDLKSNIPSEYHAQMQQLFDTYMEFSDACAEDEFINGYRFGMQMMLAAWPKGDLKEG